MKKKTLKDEWQFIKLKSRIGTKIEKWKSKKKKRNHKIEAANDRIKQRMWFIKKNENIFPNRHV